MKLESTFRRGGRFVKRTARDLVDRLEAPIAGAGNPDAFPGMLPHPELPPRSIRTGVSTPSTHRRFARHGPRCDTSAAERGSIRSLSP